MAIITRADGTRVYVGESMGEFQSRMQTKRIAERGLTDSEKAAYGQQAGLVQKEAEAIAKLPVSEQQTIFSTGKYYSTPSGISGREPSRDTRESVLPYGPLRPELYDKLKQQESFVSMKRDESVAKVESILQNIKDFGRKKREGEEKVGALVSKLKPLEKKGYVDTYISSLKGGVGRISELEKKGVGKVSPYVKGGVSILKLPLESLKPLAGGVGKVGGKSREYGEKVFSKLPDFKGNDIPIPKLPFAPRLVGVPSSVKSPSKSQVLSGMKSLSEIGEAGLKYPLEHPVRALGDYYTGKVFASGSLALTSKIGKIKSIPLRGTAKGLKIGGEAGLVTIYGLSKLQEGTKEYGETGKITKTLGETGAELGLFSLGARSVTQSKEALLKKYSKEIERLPSFQQEKIRGMSKSELTDLKFVERLEKVRVSTMEKDRKGVLSQIQDLTTKLSKSKSVKPQKVIPLRGGGLISKSESGVVVQKGFQSLGTLKKGEVKLFTGRESELPKNFDFNKDVYFPNLGKKIKVTKQFVTRDIYNLKADLLKGLKIKEVNKLNEAYGQYSSYNREIEILKNLKEPIKSDVKLHELGHDIDISRTGEKINIDVADLKKLSRKGLIQKKEFYKSYIDVPNDWYAKEVGIPREIKADLIRSYLTKPKKLEKVSPETFKSINKLLLEKGVVAGKYKERVSLKEPLTYLRSLPERKVTPVELVKTFSVPKSKEKVFTFAELEPYKRVRKVVGKSVRMVKPKRVIDLDKILKEAQLKQITKQVSVSKPVVGVREIKSDSVSVSKLVPKNLSSLGQVSSFKMISKDVSKPIIVSKELSRIKEVKKPIIGYKPVSRIKEGFKPISVIKSLISSKSDVRPVSKISELQKLKEETKLISKVYQLQELRQKSIKFGLPKEKKKEVKEPLLFNFKRLDKMFKKKAKKKGRITPQLTRFTPTLLGSGRKPIGKIFYIGGEAR